MKVLGIVLILAGIAVFFVPQIPFKQSEKVLDIGPIQATATQEKHFAIPPLLGVALIGGGAIIIGAGVLRKKS